MELRFKDMNLLPSRRNWGGEDHATSDKIVLLIRGAAFSPQRLGLCAILGPTLGLVGPWAAGEAAVRGVVARDVA